MSDRFRIIRPPIKIETALIAEHCARTCTWAIPNAPACMLFGMMRTELTATGMYYRLAACRAAETYNNCNQE
jgi:hypothetical protein